MSELSKTDFFFGFSDAECILSDITGKPWIETRIPNLHMIFSFSGYLNDVPSDIYSKNLNTGCGASLSMDKLNVMRPKPSPEKILEMLVKKCSTSSVIQILCGMNPEHEEYNAPQKLDSELR